MATDYSLGELAKSVQDWCNAHGVLPANGQVAEAITERTIRYYRALDLLDPPAGPPGRSFSEKHRLQLLAIRLFQAQGLPLRKIRDAVRAKSEEELRALVRPEMRTRAPELPIPAPSGEAAPNVHHWIVATIDDDLLLVSRRGRPLSSQMIAKVRQALNQDFTPTEPPAPQNP